ncbi:PH domain-containing protein [Halorubrum vacuolatum]|uniref:Putative membrane protein n=1 Tax=Halorubrum vacuolatum TaxID=63740 RepID=A0A238W5U4_HALVU|nr:PH domain-containing protein [Halorubrum vacuolatum]SNR41906.1 putative membrane protein [Halorubrum vacuolatum]
MKLAPQSVPYRALQRGLGFAVLAFFILNASDAGGTGLTVAVAAGIVLVALAYEAAYYQRFEYVLTEDTFDISSGVISRREREIPYRRIQNVDVSRNVVQRALGIAAVDLETAGGSATEGSIRYVTVAEATRLQRELQRRKSGANGSPGELDEHGEPVAPTEEDLFAITPGELALVGALSFDGRLIGLLAFLGSGSVPVLSGFIPTASAAILTATAIVAVGLLFLASWVLGAAIAFSNYYGFRLSRAGDELRYERGLFRRYSGSIPTEKVQTLTIADNPAKRALGYASLSIETAGYAPGQGGDQGSQAAVPIARTDRVYDLAREVEPFGEPSFHRPPRRIRWRYVFRYTMVVAALTGILFAVDWWTAGAIPWYGPLLLLLAVPPAAHLKWKHRGYWLGEDHLLTRNGFWSRQVKVVPYYRIQNVIDTRTIFQRRWYVATVVADTAGTGSLMGSNAAAVDFDIDEAVTLRRELNDRLQDALIDRRARRTAFEWFEGDPMEIYGASADAGTDSAADAGTGSVVDVDADDVVIDDAEADPAVGAALDADDMAGTDRFAGIDGVEDVVDAEGVDDTTDVADAEEGDDGMDAADAEEGDDADDLDIPPDGVIRPDFSVSDRDYSQPAERVDTGDYAVDRHPSDADVPFRPDDESSSGGADGDDDDTEHDEASADDDATPGDDRSGR